MDWSTHVPAHPNHNENMQPIKQAREQSINPSVNTYIYAHMTQEKCQNDWMDGWNEWRRRRRNKICWTLVAQDVDVAAGPCGLDSLVILRPERRVRAIISWSIMACNTRDKRRHCVWSLHRGLPRWLGPRSHRTNWRNNQSINQQLKENQRIKASKN